MNEQELGKLGTLVGQQSALFEYAKQSNCEHEWDTGDDDGNTFYRCIKCGKDKVRTDGV